MSRSFPDPTAAYPVTWPGGETRRLTVHLNRVIDHPNFEIGDFTYYSDFEEVGDHARHLAPYLFDTSRERLIIGKFCQIAHGTKFVTSSSMHPMDGFSTYPFSIFHSETMGDYAHLAEIKGDTVIGHDVWFGYGATILPGARIGSGAIIGAKAVVGGQVPPYAIVVGNPGRLLRTRFDASIIARLLEVAWWDWPTDHIARHRDLIEASDIDALEAVCPAVSG